MCSSRYAFALIAFRNCLRFVHARQLDAVLAERIDQLHAGLVGEVLDFRDLKAPGRGR